MFIADSCAFLAGHGQPQVADPNLQLDLLHFTFASAMNGPQTMASIFARGKQAIENLNQQHQLCIMRSQRDLRYLGEGVAVVLGTQAPPEAADLSVDHLRQLRRLGVVFTTLAYDVANRYGGGFASPETPLSKDGQQLMQWCADVGIVIDLSHAGHLTAADALAHARAHKLPSPVATHTACYDLHPHPRNLPDELLRQISERGGVVGIVSLTSYLHDGDESHDVAAFYRHLCHAVDVCGVDAVCIGSDGYYCRRDLTEWRSSHDRIMQKLGDRQQIFGVRWPDQPLLWNRPDRMMLIAGDLRAHLAYDEVNKVVGENFLRYLQTVL